jgi:hypothetical protein
MYSPIGVLNKIEKPTACMIGALAMKPLHRPTTSGIGPVGCTAPNEAVRPNKYHVLR